MADRLRFHQEEVENYISRLNEIDSEMQNVQKQIKSIISTADPSVMEVRFGFGVVEDVLDDYAKDASKYGDKSRRLSSALNRVSTIIMSAEKELAKGIKEDGTKSGELDWNSLAAAIGAGHTGQSISLLKALLKIGDKSDSSDIAGLGAEGIAYLQAVYKFFAGDKKGLTGARDLFNLGDKSVSSWTELYDYLKDNKTDGIFSLTNQKRVATLDIAGGAFGLVSSAFDVANTIKSGDAGTAGIIGEIIGAGDSAVDIWGGVEKLIHVGDEAANITTREGLYSPLSLYSTTAKGYLSAVSQGFKSYDKYTADGSFTVMDAGRTGVESSVKGLYSMVEGLSFGFLSEDTTGVSADEVSQAIEDFAEDTGTKAGQYVLDNPELLSAYQNGGPFKRFLTITYAISKTW
ncbi:MAG: hypothetical protein IJ719_00405 [Clostridia bacterium]|nr:hypothetical protein [Clostridia bacterium]